MRNLFFSNQHQGFSVINHSLGTISYSLKEWVQVVNSFCYRIDINQISKFNFLQTKYIVVCSKKLLLRKPTKLFTALFIYRVNGKIETEWKVMWPLFPMMSLFQGNKGDFRWWYKQSFWIVWNKKVPKKIRDFVASHEIFSF